MNTLALIAFLTAVGMEGVVSDSKNGTSFSTLFRVPSNHRREKISSTVRRHKSHDFQKTTSFENAPSVQSEHEAWADADSLSAQGDRDSKEYPRCYSPTTILGSNFPPAGFEAALRQPKLGKEQLRKTRACSTTLSPTLLPPHP